MHRRVIWISTLFVILSSCNRSDSGGSVQSTDSDGLQPIGWDPGMRTPRAVGISLDETMEPFSFCPQEPNGVCDGIPSGGGFYNLSLGSDFVNAAKEPDSRGCRASHHNTPLESRPVVAKFGDPTLHEFSNIRCPYLFHWTADERGPIANMSIDSTTFGHDLTPNIYLGIQRNLATGASRGGMRIDDPVAAPAMNDVDEISFAYRASVCDARNSGWFYGRGVFILEVYNQNYPNTKSPTGKGRGMQLSVNIFEYLRGVNRADVPGALVSGVKPQSAMASYNDHWSDTWHMNGSDFPQFVTTGHPYTLSPSPNCSPFASGPWQGVRIKIKDLLRGLGSTVAGFPNDPEFWNGAQYTGGTLAGIEFFGQGYVNLQLRDFSLWKRPGGGPIFAGGAAPRPDAPSPQTPPPAASGELHTRLLRDAACPFNGGNYVGKNPDIAAQVSAAQALDHYLTWGIPEGRPGGCPPSAADLPRFLEEARSRQTAAQDPRVALKAKLDVNAQCPFDGAHYLNSNPDVKAVVPVNDALNHYLNWGIREGRPGGCPPSLEALPR